MKLAALLLALLTSVGSTAAGAQVYELSDNGAVRIRDGGGAVTWRDPGAPRVVPAVSGGSQNSDGTSPMGTVYAPALRQAASHYGLSAALLEAVVWQESRWHHDAVSPKGAVGLTQLMPATALALGVDAHDPAANLDAGAHYLRILLDHFSGDVVKALAAYNAGAARVERAGGIPAIRETQNYVSAILARLDTEARKP